MLRTRFLLLPLVLVLSACSSRPPPGLTLAETVDPAASQIELLVAATRRPSEEAAVRFSGERTLQMRFARMVVSIPPGHKPGEISWSSSGRPDTKKEFAALRFDEIAREKITDELRASIRRSGRSHVLVFVHGYNTRFDEAAFRMAQIVNDSGAKVTPVLFSWASWGGLTTYPYDRESAVIARDGLEKILATLSREPSVSQVSVLAHSMGGWVTLEALRQMAIRDRRILPRITDVMLASPDVDVDVATAQGRVILAAPTRPRITLFVSTDDRALSASRLLWGSRDRLGAIDPKQEPYHTNLARSGIEVVDLSATKADDALHHGKFASSPEVVRLIGTKLAEGHKLGGEESPGDAAQGLTHGALRVVGDVLSAPLKLGEKPPPPGSGGIAHR